MTICKWLFLILLVSFNAAAGLYSDSATTDLFSGVIQGHPYGKSDCSVLRVEGGEVNGTEGEDVDFCSTENSIWWNPSACDDGNDGYAGCVITGDQTVSADSDDDYVSIDIDDNSFYYNSHGDDIRCDSGNYTLSSGERDYDDIRLSNTCNITFPQRDEYWIGSLELSNESVVTFNSGTYWIESLDLTNTSTINISGDVVIVLKNDSELDSYAKMVTPEGSSLTVRALSDLSMSNESAITGDIYVKDDFGISGSASVTGDIYVGDNMNISNSVTITGYVYVDYDLKIQGGTINGNVNAGYLVIGSGSVINGSTAGSVDPDPGCSYYDFNSPLSSDDWILSSAGTTYFKPQVVNGRLRLTENKDYEATSVTYTRQFPADNYRVEIEFDQFAYDTTDQTGADGIAVVLSNALKQPKAGAFGGPLGYGAKDENGDGIADIDGFAGGWLGIGLDEFGNFSSQGSPEIRGDDPGQTPQSIAVRGSGSGTEGYRYLMGYSFAAHNSDYLIDETTALQEVVKCNWWGWNCWTETQEVSVDNDGFNDHPVHRYKVIIDSREAGLSDLSVYRKIDDGDWVEIIEPVDIRDTDKFPNQDDAPDSFYFSVTGSTGLYNNIHEIDNFKICATKYNTTVDHIRISHSGSGVVCNPEELTITACADDDCSSEFEQEITVALTPSADVTWSGTNVSGNELTMTGKATVSLRSHSAGTLTLGTHTAETRCDSNGDGTYSTSECDIIFSDTGFIVTVADMVANSTGTKGTIQAVTTLDSNPAQCEALSVDGDADVQLWSSYITPDADLILGAPVISVSRTENGTYDPVSNDENAPSTHALVFDEEENSQASFYVTYPDAGQLELNAQFVGSGDYDGLTLKGSDSFVSVPKYLKIAAASNPRDTSRGYANSARTSGVFTEAGAEFDLTVTAYGEGNVVTPNYSQTDMQITSRLDQPSSGVLGDFAEGDLSKDPDTEGVYLYDHIPATGAANTLTTSYDEVGSITVEVAAGKKYTIEGTDYPQDSGTLTISRFTPDYLSVTGNTLDISDACGDFSYLSQPLSFISSPELAVSGMSAGGTETHNYQMDGWWKYAPDDWDGRSYASSTSTLTVEEVSSDSDESVTVSNYDATQARTVTLDGVQMGYVKLADAREPLDDNIVLSLSAADLDDSDGICFRENASDSSCAGFSFATPVTTHNHRWGRLVLEDTYGPETNPLQGMARTEYYLDGNFTLNTEDQCTNLSYNTLVFKTDSEIQSFDSITVGSGTTEASIGQQPNGNGGEGYLSYSAPGSGNQGIFTVTANLDTMPWLLPYDSDGSGEIDAADDDPDATVQFGIYRGSDRIIWWTEQLE